MGQRILFPQWRAENEPTKYPFAMSATLTNGTQFILEGTFLDATLFPIGGRERMYLSKAVIEHDQATLFIGDEFNSALASATFKLIRPADNIRFTDSFGRPAGMIVSERRRLSLFAGWGVGTHTFTQEQTEFAATVCVPTPQLGVRGIILEDGSLFVGDVWIAGTDGVVVRHETVNVPAAACGEDREYQVIRVDVVGDPLFRRRLCQPSTLFETPKYVKTITFRDRQQSVICGPNKFGDVKLTVNNALADDTVLRVHPTPEGNKVEVVGSLLKSVR